MERRIISWMSCRMCGKEKRYDVCIPTSLCSEWWGNESQELRDPLHGAWVCDKCLEVITRSNAKAYNERP